jgi:hypothetical protein
VDISDRGEPMTDIPTIDRVERYVRERLLFSYIEHERGVGFGHLAFIARRDLHASEQLVRAAVGQAIAHGHVINDGDTYRTVNDGDTQTFAV